MKRNLDDVSNDKSRTCALFLTEGQTNDFVAGANTFIMRKMYKEADQEGVSQCDKIIAAARKNHNIKEECPLCCVYGILLKPICGGAAVESHFSGARWDEGKCSEHQGSEERFFNASGDFMSPTGSATQYKTRDY